MKIYKKTIKMQKSKFCKLAVEKSNTTPFSVVDDPDLLTVLTNTFTRRVRY